MRNVNNSSSSSAATMIKSNKSTTTTTVFRSCTEFSHERSKHPLSSATVVSKLLIQPAHLRSHSVSHWPSPESRNPGATLLHACEHFSVLPAMANGNKQVGLF
uniref:Ovule protein n=1 Tax=Meloidogyne hapla TaxID=6305 RepID=A0A1I8B525_MELHA